MVREHSADRQEADIVVRHVVVSQTDMLNMINEKLDIILSNLSNSPRKENKRKQRVIQEEDDDEEEDDEE